MNISDFNIIAKLDNKEIYMIEYRKNSGFGFVVDLDKCIRYDDENIEELRKHGFWFDFHCSENVARRILEEVINMKSDEM